MPKAFNNIEICPRQVQPKGLDRANEICLSRRRLRANLPVS